MPEPLIMPESRTCAECGEAIPPHSPEGCCPRCLLGLAAAVATEEMRSPGHGACGESSAPASAPSSYELLELIGEGGMGVVFKARQRTLNRIVALKMIRSGSFASESEVRRFQTEAQAAAKLQHANVVAIHEVGEQDGRPYFSMDYVEGQNLAQIVRQTPLSPERAARYVQTIAATVHYAHQRGILHRDLKPANILIDATDQPRITDFGLAKQLEADSEFTVSGAVLGTPSYMPPEQAAGKRQELGPASDIYSLGAILYDLLTGRPPFRADTPVDTLRQVLDDEPAPPRLLNRKVPRDLETICLKCLAKEPRQRYESAQHLAEDLGRFLKHEPIHARPVGQLGRLWRLARRNPVIAAFSIVVIGLLLMLAVGAIFQRHEAMLDAQEAARDRAMLVDAGLTPLRNAVNSVAGREILARHLASGATNELRALLQQELEQLNEDQETSWLLLQNWVLVTPEGKTVLRLPQLEKQRSERADRDYFKGAMERSQRTGLEAVHVSRTYKSLDDNLYKFGVSRAILKTNGEVAGVLTLMVRPTQFAKEALGTIAEGREFVLASEWEPSPLDRASRPEVRPPEREFVIIIHPAMGENDVEQISSASLARVADASGALPQGDSLYRDPVAHKHREYKGWWLAGFARVPNTQFIVIYQTRDWVLNAAWLSGVVSLLAGFPLLLWWWTRRRRRKNDASAIVE
jgi:eukaryotic-like serine/threonine-protein kinase